MICDRCGSVAHTQEQWNAHDCIPKQLLLQNYLIIIRGWSGSGKSTLARRIRCVLDPINFQYSYGNPKYKHYEADNYFIDQGVYKFNKDELNVAHAFCYHNVFSALEAGINCIVSNTFIKLSEMLPYIKFAQLLDIKWTYIDCKRNYNNIHGAPVEVVNYMKEFFEDAIDLENEINYIEYTKIPNLKEIVDGKNIPEFLKISNLKEIIDGK